MNPPNPSAVAARESASSTGAVGASPAAPGAPGAPGVGRGVLAQLFLCKGCCCGQTERGRPPVPVDEIKAIWKAEKLNRSVQLTVSGCLGPCKLANVALVLSPQRADWIGRLQGEADYSALIDWARSCHATRQLAPTPATLLDRTFERFDSGR